MFFICPAIAVEIDIICLVCKEVIFFCLREEPVVFLRLEGDFLPYTPRRKENLHENLHDLGRELSSENLELTIRKEVRRLIM